MIVFKNLSENDSLDQLYRRFKIYKVVDGKTYEDTSHLNDVEEL